MVSSGDLLQKIYFLLPFTYPAVNQIGQSGTSNAEWSYDDTNWGTNYSQCNGLRQSPIHIQSRSSFILPTPPLRFKNYDTPLQGPIELINNGHSVEFAVPKTVDGNTPSITGGILKTTYEAVGVHFHWGGPGTKGSEHIIDGRQFDVEMHIVHKKSTFATVEEATQHPYGLAVLGVMFKGTTDPDRIYPGLNKIFNKLADVEEYDSSTFLDGTISLGQMLGDLYTKNFFTYKGSLTTPGCSEAVLWHVFPDPLPIAQKHIEKFWSILDKNGDPLTNNFRPVQNLNGRKVYYHLRGATTDWTYDNAPNWSRDHPNCAGNRQSPIHIKTSTWLSAVEFQVPPTVNGRRPFVSGGVLKSKYEAIAVHFHWGSKSSKGSEHMIDNRRFDVEMHIVHKNVIYPTMTEAAKHVDGLTVLAVMFKATRVVDRIYPGLNMIFHKLPYVVHMGSSTVLPQNRISLGHLLGDLNIKTFFTYTGSLTTPDCSEAVTWHIFPEPLPIAYENIEKFWQINDVHGQKMNNNFRPLQQRNGVVILYRAGSY
ncbi:carbonic anhydrase 9-like [Musca autumnalis]|uniref:carbonic anhydrase 9-like n=1 Tax=Musca autumnalis TaxID=221902 RepID=UPI003CF9091F